MHEPLEALAGTIRIAAVERALRLAIHEVRFTRRACSRRDVFRRTLSALIGHRTDDLRNDVAGALHLHSLARTNVLSIDEIVVVERRELDHRAADLDRREHGVRIHRPRTP